MDKKKQLGDIFPQLEVLSRNKKMSSRLRFMCQDVIDLKKDKWVSRLKPVLKAKKLNELHKDESEDKKRQAQDDRRRKERQANELRGGGAPAPRSNSALSGNQPDLSRSHTHTFSPVVLLAL